MQDESIKSPPSQATGDPTSSLASLLSDPAMLSKLGTVLSAIQGTQNDVSKQKNEPSIATDRTQTLPADGLSKLLADPTILEKLPQIISVIKPLLNTAPASISESTSDSALPVYAPTHAHTAERDNLLLAIKPFLSSGRRDAVDTILRLEKLGDFLKQIK